MTYDALGQSALDYLPCRYGKSRLLFRGPKRKLVDPYCAFLGGTETYGKFIEKPFPGLVEDDLGMPCLNLGQVNAGIDVFTQDPFVLDAASKAQVTVVQILGAQNMTNRFYAVHPRRNDRFVSASTLLQTIYREVDFSEFHFTKHMLGHLSAVCPIRFQAVRDELRNAWLARMAMLLKQIDSKTVLVWITTENVREKECLGPELGHDPLFVTREMMAQVSEDATMCIEITVPAAAQDAGRAGMVFNEMEASVAAEMMGPDAHEETAANISAALRKVL